MGHISMHCVIPGTAEACPQSLEVFTVSHLKRQVEYQEGVGLGLASTLYFS